MRRGTDRHADGRDQTSIHFASAMPHAKCNDDDNDDDDDDDANVAAAGDVADRERG